ncbi:hypothetical protein [uncultured Pontibacter sp.]|uniref:hypothetical protein n=1 Tax=uncultured Pontibacter sp. TaxID=453356 RepID=UPI00260D41DA|nr:hypothetical protein [uncultured Pontibacter sp.]
MELVELLTVYGISASKVADYIGLTRGAFNNKMKGSAGRGFSKNEQDLIQVLFNHLKNDLESPIQFTKSDSDSNEIKMKIQEIKDDLKETQEVYDLITDIKKKRGRKKLSELNNKDESNYTKD